MAEHTAAALEYLADLAGDSAMGEPEKVRAAVTILRAALRPAPAPCCPEPQVAIDSGWLVEVHHHCTIGCEPTYGHQPGCGLIPVVQLDNLTGWPAPPAHPTT